MLAVEFQANIQNGLVEVPERYRQELENYKNVRVIILVDETQPQVDMIDYLLEHPIKVDNQTPLKRDEIYDRK
ncbi:hypothetical protein WA1_26905 [Scytonema hofmannii PCC 7110]|jgi:hypothetical protein|uniref:Uncharacterized protein n=1 Tax=Scytonema hofmannii PCC 7110 TaxID=128403 RepID=A0A139X6B7_9CYAN|nr:hypothetical protein [Scytonema hofmannii]KYC40172.1 hypothetical protein WA1_26905 [Scytonema hofmannii PCC 7110]